MQSLKFRRCYLEIINEIFRESKVGRDVKARRDIICLNDLINNASYYKMDLYDINQEIREEYRIIEELSGFIPYKRDNDIIQELQIDVIGIYADVLFSHNIINSLTDLVYYLDDSRRIYLN